MYSCGKVEFCLTKLQALRATSSTFTPGHSVHVLNAYGLFAVMIRSEVNFSAQLSVPRCKELTGVYARFR